ncbi:hypothetical protein QR680_009305 [Steinernema hermaphroditum]|uniref:BTB domain-containing protein n=1 Tax=Steinernema hermaphroditum TaxID=289476 RepID=A0AA39M9G5_9BILA|nr:hypothetical protein QR680_009305 [Steinernema hermaphroditum]
MFPNASGILTNAGNEGDSGIRAAEQDESNDDGEAVDAMDEFLTDAAVQPSSSSISASRNLSSPLTSNVGDVGSASEYPSEYASLPPSSDKAEGSIKLNISNLSSLRTKVTTSYHMIANLPWRLAAKTECSKRTSNVKYFSVYIDCNPESESTLWACDAQVEFKLTAQRSGLPDYTRQFSNKFNYNSNNWGFPSFMEWNEILTEDKGYTRGDRVVVEARIVVHKVNGVKKSPTFDFRSAQPNISDVVLLVDGVRLYVSKAYLALYSPVFNAMFFSKFSERTMREIQIEDVLLEEFIELLNVVYPSHKSITAENVEFLLELGDKFEIQYVMDECENFLMRTDDIAVVTKLVWADQYTLAKLHDACIRTLKTVPEIKALKATEEYKNFSDTTKAALLEKILKVVP